VSAMMLHFATSFRGDGAANRASATCRQTVKADLVMWYNFALHQTLRVTPAMEAGISSHVWPIKEIVALGISVSAIAA
jgi:hypothetical protein